MGVSRVSASSFLSSVGRPVAYYPSITRAFGGDPLLGIFVCQFAYWRGRTGKVEIYKTRQEIEEETAISPHMQRKITKQLEDMGALTVTKKGLPAKNYYRFNWDVVDSIIGGHLQSTSANGHE